VTHDFHERLAFSHAQADQPWWETVYRLAFHGFKCMVDMREDGVAQRAGIDRYVHLRGGKILAVDEKVREKDYDDILLERWSDRERQHAGWVQKPLLCDYVAYAFVPSARCYLLPVPQLRRAWATHGRRWIAERSPVLAANRGYTTECVPVPIPELLEAICDALVVHWGGQGEASR
jgi:hypothetical protein